MNYTKEKWKTKMSADGSRIIYAEKESGDELICRDVRHYNMNLISAAPAMYEALRKAKLLLDRPYSDAWHICAEPGTQITVGDVIDKSLAQAEGR